MLTDAAARRYVLRHSVTIGGCGDRKESPKSHPPLRNRGYDPHQMRRIALLLTLVAASVAAPSAAGATSTSSSATSVQTAPASITRVSVTRVNGVRVVVVRLNVTRHTDAVARLRRNGKTLASTRRVHLMPGARTMKIRVARSVRRGPATVVVRLISGGNAWTLRRGVTLPRP